MTIRKYRIDVSQIKTYIDTFYKEQFTLELLAVRFHFSKNYLVRVFKEAYGMSVRNYIALVRIRKAKELLRFTNMNIDQCSYECGFGDPNYFSRIFKKVEGCSPSKFRKNWMSRSSGKE